MFGAERRAFKRPAEESLIRGQERTGVNSKELIETQESRAQEALQNFRLIAMLQGEGSFSKIVEEADANVQIEIAIGIIHSVPFVVKYIPDHLTEVAEQAGFIVAVAEAMSEVDKNLN